MMVGSRKVGSVFAMVFAIWLYLFPEIRVLYNSIGDVTHLFIRRSHKVVIGHDGWIYM